MKYDKNQKTKKQSNMVHIISDQDISINNGSFPKNTSTNNSPNSFLINKLKRDKDKKCLLKSLRGFEYNSGDDIFTKNLKIDTRNTGLSFTNTNKPKFNFVEYRHKKYQNHKFPFKKSQNIESYEKNNNFNYYSKNNTDLNNIDQENIPLNKKIINMKYQAINRPIDGSFPRFPLNYDHLPHRAVGNSLYTVLAMRKNQFMDAFDKAKEKEKAELPKLKQMKYLLGHSKNTMENYFGNKKNFAQHVDLLKQPLNYISLLKDDFSISEKMRFQKIMYKLTKVKKYILANPEREFEIAKEFILSVGIYDLNNFDIDKLNNFLVFIKGDFLIDPSKDIKENIEDVLNNKNSYKPPMSNAMDCINEEYFLNEMKKRKNAVKHKKIGEQLSFFNENYSKNDDMNNISKIQTTKKNKTSINFRKGKSEKKSERRNRQRPLEHKGLCVNLKRQQEINLLDKRKELDLIKSPKLVIEMIEKEIKKSKDNIRAKTHYNWSRNILKNNRLYGNKKEKVDLNEIKKKNMLTEYICLMKAKNNVELHRLKEKYQI